jgi:hypothetical protein
MLDELNAAIKDYQTKWKGLVAARADKAFFEGLKTTAVAWKTTDLAEFDHIFAELREKADQIHLGWINERWLGTIHLREGELEGGIKIVKLMQRRPGSKDAVGLDHVDFYSPQVEGAQAILKAEPDLKWTSEDNDHCHWLSLWFDGTEAKLRTGTTISACIKELETVNEQVIDKS